MITHVAIRFRGKVYALPAPNRHHDIIRYIWETTGERYADADDADDDQGFLDDSGRYHSRASALEIARQAGQLRPDREVIGDWLYSENLW